MELYTLFSVLETMAPAESSTVLPTSTAHPNPGTLPQVTYTFVPPTNLLYPTEPIFQELQLKLGRHLKLEPQLDFLHPPHFPTCPQFPTLHHCPSYQPQEAHLWVRYQLGP